MINDAIRELEDSITNSPIDQLVIDLKNAEEQAQYWTHRIKILENDIEIHARELQLMQTALGVLQS